MSAEENEWLSKFTQFREMFPLQPLQCLVVSNVLTTLVQHKKLNKKLPKASETMSA